MKNKVIIFSFFLLSLVVLNSAYAKTFNLEVTNYFKLNPDASADYKISIPMDTNHSEFQFDPEGFQSDLYKYDITSAQIVGMPKAKFSTNYNRNVVIETGLPNSPGSPTLEINFKGKSSFTKGLVIHNLTRFEDGGIIKFLDKTHTKIDYNKNLFELVDTDGVVESFNPLSIVTNEEEYFQPTLIFMKKNLPKGIIKKEIENKFVIIGTKEEVRKIESALTYLRGIDNVFFEVFGERLPNKIYIEATDLDIFKAEALGYQFGKKVIFLNSEDFGKVTSLNVASVLAHELGHIVVSNAKLFSSAPAWQGQWIVEGLPTFFSQLFFDKYVFKNSTSSIESFANLDYDFRVNPYWLKEWNKLGLFSPSFDLINTKDFTYGNGYTFSSLIFRNYYDKLGTSSIKNLFSKLKTSTSRSACSVCDTDTTIDLMKKESGLTRDQIVFPYKGEEDDLFKKYNFFAPDYDEDQDKANQNRAKTADREWYAKFISYENYFGLDKKVKNAKIKKEIIKK